MAGKRSNIERVNSKMKIQPQEHQKHRTYRERENNTFCGACKNAAYKKICRRCPLSKVKNADGSEIVLK